MIEYIKENDNNREVYILNPIYDFNAEMFDKIVSFSENNKLNILLPVDDDLILLNKTIDKIKKKYRFDNNDFDAEPYTTFRIKKVKDKWDMIKKTLILGFEDCKYIKLNIYE